LIDLAVDQGIIEKSGAWYSFKGERIGQGRDNSKLYLKEHPEIAETIEAMLRDKLGLPVIAGGDAV